MGAPKYVRYEEQEFFREFSDDMNRDCLIPGAVDGHLRISFDPAKYRFKKLIAEFLLTKGFIKDEEQSIAAGKNLETLHTSVDIKDQLLDETQHNAVAVALYDLQGRFIQEYETFVCEEIVPALGLGGLHWQVQPTFRVFFPYSKGYPGKTTYHNDLMLGHNPREVNVFLPFTSCINSRSLLMAPLGKSLDVCRQFNFDFAAFADAVQNDAALQQRCAQLCQPLEMDYGEALIFDSRCLHAGPPNMTDLTRVTIDFRVLPEQAIADQKNTYQGTGRRKALFAPGGVFSAEPAHSTNRNVELGST